MESEIGDRRVAPTGGDDRWYDLMMMRLRRTLAAACAALLLVGAVPSATSARESAPYVPESARVARPGRVDYLRNVYRVTGNLRSLATLRGARAIRPLDESTQSLATARISFAEPLDEEGFKQKQSELRLRGITLERITIYRAQTITDPDYVDGQQWDMRPYSKSTNPGGLNVEDAWSITTGSGAVVAVLDTGFLAGHPDFVGLDVLPGWDFVSAYDNDATPGWDSDPSDPGDGIDNGNPAHDEAQAACGGASSSSSSWHGTHVAGTILAQPDSTGITGIAPDASLLPVRVLGQCGGDDADIAAAIRWAAGLHVAGVPDNANPADVINMSLGGWGQDCDTPMGAAITEALAAGTITVVAAGNESDDARNYSPASCADAVTVAALGPSGAPAPYTNVGPAVDISAPGGDGYFAPSVTPSADYPGGCPFGVTSLSDLGVPGWSGAPSIWCTPWTDWSVDGGIISTISTDEFDYDGNFGYSHYEGTSMATPHVAGVVALIRAEYPTMPVSSVVAVLTSRTGQYYSNDVPNNDFKDLSWMTNWLLAWGGVDGIIAPGLSLTPSQVLSYDWTSYWSGELPCSPTAVGSMAYLVLGGDPCSKVSGNLLKASYWELSSWSAYGKANGEGWYSVKSGGACKSLGCGQGSVNAYKSLLYAEDWLTRYLITNNQLPSVQGSVGVQRTLRSSAGRWTSRSRLTYQYQWYSCSAQVLAGGATLDGTCDAVSGANKNSYRLNPGVSGSYLLVGVTASNGFTTLTRYSASTSVVAP